MEFYSLSGTQIYERFATKKQGLSQEEAEARLKQYGPNQLKREDKIKVIKLIFSQINSSVVYILIAAFLISVFLGEKLDSIVIGSVIILNTSLGFFQEYKAEKSIRALKRLSEPKSFVLRNNEVKEVDTDLVVPGDIVLLESGSFIPADCYIVEAYELKTDESLLTGDLSLLVKGLGLSLKKGR